MWTSLFLDCFATLATTMGKIIRLWWKGRRLKGLDEFRAPEFVGRMERVERRRKLTLGAVIATGVAIGVGLGLILIR
jgi:hypothetical protein